MSTPHSDDLLSARLDNELDAAAAWAVDQHLRDCASCRQELLAIGEARRALRTAPPVPAPIRLVTDFVGRRRRAERWGRTIAAAAAVVALAAGVAVADPNAVTAPRDKRQQNESHVVATWDARARRDTPQSVRHANETAAAEPSLTDRIEEAIRGLLDFLG